MQCLYKQIIQGQCKFELLLRPEVSVSMIFNSVFCICYCEKQITLILLMSCFDDDRIGAIYSVLLSSSITKFLHSLV